MRCAKHVAYRVVDYGNATLAGIPPSSPAAPVGPELGGATRVHFVKDVRLNILNREISRPIFGTTTSLRSSNNCTG